MLFKVTRLCLKSTKPIVGRTAKFAGINLVNKASKADKSNKTKKIVPNTVPIIVSDAVPNTTKDIQEQPVKTVDKIVNNTVSQNIVRKQGPFAEMDPLETYVVILFAIIATLGTIVLCSIIVSETMRLYRMGW